MLTRNQVAARRGSITALGSLVTPNYDALRWWFQDVLADHLEKAVRYARYGGKRGGIPRLLVSLPRRCGKTEHASVLAPASFLGLSPKLHVMSTAYNRELVGEMVKRTRGYMTSDAYARTFATRIGKATDSLTDKQISATDTAFRMDTLVRDPDGRVQPAGGSYYAVGVKGGATGHGFHLGIIDDWIRDRESAHSVAETRRRINFYDAAFESGQEGSAALLAIATTWRKHGLLDWLYAKWKAQGYDPIWLRFPALYDPEIACEWDRRTQIDEPLWPLKFSQEHLTRVRLGLLESNPEVWWALYQQHGRGESGIIFPKDRWRWFDSSFKLSNLQEIHISVDPNQKASGNSFGCAGVYGVIDMPPQESADQSRAWGVNYFRTDEARGHWDYPMLRAEVKRLLIKWSRHPAFWNPKGRVWIEDKANGPALIADLRESMPEFAGKIEVVPKMRNKESCYRLAAPVVKEQRVWLCGEEYDLCTADWAKHIEINPATGEKIESYPEGTFVPELEAQQPTHEPNDRADEFAQMIICREPNLTMEMLRI